MNYQDVITILYSIVDVGSNTVRLVTYETRGISYRPVYTKHRALGLVSKIENGMLTAEATDELCNTLNLFRAVSPPNAVLLAFATAFMRVISNSSQVLDEVHKRTGIELEILSDEAEALFSFNGVIRSLSSVKDGIVADLGGGSCEFIKFSHSLPNEHISFKFGCVNLRKSFVNGNGFPTISEIDAIRSYVTDTISTENWIKDSASLVLTGGTARALAQIDNFVKGTKLPLSNYTFTKASIDELYNQFTSFDRKYVGFILNSLPERITTIYPGFAAIKAITDYISCDRIIISTEGVREGYLSEKLRR